MIKKEIENNIQDVVEYDRKGLLKIFPYNEKTWFSDKITVDRQAKKAMALMKIRQEDCEGHFSVMDGKKIQILPGHVWQEALAQVLGVIYYATDPKAKENIGLYSEVKSRFFEPAFIGDQVSLSVSLSKVSDKKLEGVGVAIFAGRVITRADDIVINLVSKKAAIRMLESLRKRHQNLK